MSEAAIPNRALFKATEVCEIAELQPYVLRSWEMEFTDLGVAKTIGGPRVYRRGDVERVLRIKHLVFAEGLTLAGVRRRMEEERPTGTQDAPLEELLGRHARERVALVRTGLRSLLDMLSRAPGQAPDEYRLTAPAARRAVAPTRDSKGQSRRARPASRTPPTGKPTVKKKASRLRGA
jgi:DNA-binding transcriptional MerR regulator